MKIGNVQLKNNLILAPIAGFSEVGFRHLCAKFGAGLTVTEMVSAKGICYNNKNSIDLLRTSPYESVKCVQLFGSDPEFMYKASKHEMLQEFDIIDINMGCPVKKIFCNGEGSALMNNPNLIYELVKATKEGAKRPVTVKLRAGVNIDEPLALKCAVMAQKGGCDAVSIHARYREQFYSGKADHDITRLVKEELNIPVIANGDIVCKKSLNEVKDITKADGFMIARGALGNPYIFAQLLGIDIEIDKKSAILEHISVLREFILDRVVANCMKLHLCHYASNSPIAKNVRVAVSKANNIEDIFSIVEEYFV